MSALRATVHRLRRQDLVRQGAVAIGFGGATLVINLVSGVLIARLLGPTGRGQVTATITLISTIGALSALGARQSVAYHIARRPEDSRTILGGWLLTAPVLGVIGVIVVELLLPTLFSAQSATALTAARIYALVIIGLTLQEVAYGTLQGHQRFVRFSELQFGVPTVINVLYGVAAASHVFSVDLALALTAVTTCAFPVATLVWLAAVYGVARPVAAVMRSTLAFGAKAYLAATASFVNFNLDLLVMPAILSARQIGFYAAANSISYVVIGLAGSLVAVAMPAATRRGAEGYKTIIVGAYVSLIIALVLSVVLAIAAPVAVKLVYGDKFAPAISALRALLIGTVFVPSTTILSGGLFSVNRPDRASIAYLCGAVTTIVGLLLFLRSGGVMAAAWISTIAYVQVFATALFMYRRTIGVPWSAMLPQPSAITAFIRASRPRTET